MIKNSFREINEGKIPLSALGTIEQTIISPVIASTEASAVWNAIGEKIPIDIRPDAQKMVNQLFDEITDEEIDYVNKFLQQI